MIRAFEARENLCRFVAVPRHRDHHSHSRVKAVIARTG
jgi:hypothetical protein